MTRTRIVEYAFFFGILGATGYVMWQIIAPFFGALAMASIIATVSYPLYTHILRYIPRHNRSIASMLTTLLIAVLVVTPLAILGYLIFTEALSFYISLNRGQGLLFDQSVTQIETLVRQFAPSFTLDVHSYARQAAGWFIAHIGTIFAETASTIFLIFIAIIGVFYAFRDGEESIRYFIRLSPLADSQDEHILKQLARSVRSVVLGTLVIALVQGLLTTAGFAIFGVGQPVLWGAVAAVGSLIPGIGTMIVFAPALVLLLLQGSYTAAIGIAIWGTLAVGMIDNLLGPYLISRGMPLHPFLVLLSVLGGITLFGPMGFVLGPVALSLFSVLLDLHGTQVLPTKSSDEATHI